MAKTKKRMLPAHARWNLTRNLLPGGGILQEVWITEWIKGSGWKSIQLILCDRCYDKRWQIEKQRFNKSSRDPYTGRWGHRDSWRVRGRGKVNSWEKLECYDCKRKNN